MVMSFLNFFFFNIYLLFAILVFYSVFVLAVVSVFVVFHDTS